MVRRELLGGSYIPLLSPVSKIALFMAEIPKNIKNIFSSDVIFPNKRKNRFPKIPGGFSGTPLDYEAYLLLARYDGNIKESVVELVDLQNFKVIYKWNPKIDDYFSSINTFQGSKWEDLLTNYNDSRFRIVSPILEAGGDLVVHHRSPLIKINRLGDLIWMKDDHYYHHASERDHLGHYWVCVEYFPFSIDKKYVGNNYNNFIEDGIRQISNDGEILFDKSVAEIFIENDMEYLLFAIGDRGFTKDPTHLNDIEPVNFDSDYWKAGDVFISLRHQSMVLLYRPNTNEIIWKGTGKFYHQHDVNILDSHRISIFNNNSKDFFSGDTVDGVNEVLIYDFKTNKYSSYLNDSFIEYDIKTITQGTSRILPNQDLFIEETDYGRTLYFNKDGSLRWYHLNKSDNNNIYAVSWSKILYDKTDLDIVNKFID